MSGLGAVLAGLSVAISAAMLQAIPDPVHLGPRRTGRRHGGGRERVVQHGPSTTPIAVITAWVVVSTVLGTLVTRRRAVA